MVGGGAETYKNRGERDRGGEIEIEIERQRETERDGRRRDGLSARHLLSRT